MLVHVPELNVCSASVSGLSGDTADEVFQFHRAVRSAEFYRLGLYKDKKKGHFDRGLPRKIMNKHIINDNTWQQR